MHRLREGRVLAENCDSSQHGKHHAQTSHLTGDQVYIPNTRSELGLPPLDHERENLEGTKVSTDLQALFSEALEDAPIVSIIELLVKFVSKTFHISRLKG